VIAPPAAREGEEALLVIEGAPVYWATRCRDLAHLTLEEEWLGAPAVDAAAALGLEAPGGEAPSRVVVLRCPGGELALRIGARLAIAAFPTSALCPLPTRLLGTGSAVFERIVFHEGRAVLVVDPAGVARRCRLDLPPAAKEPPEP
jgi:hypothetical protein